MIDPHDEALAAAEAAGVLIAPVAEVAELDELRAAMEHIWGAVVVPPRNLLRGLALGGACLLTARRDDAVVGFALGWLGWTGGVHLHSHQVGVAASERRGGVGVALKLAQRAQCLQHGITEMRWTFDPVLATNARFNLVRLGARVIDFLPHCYGDRVDAFNTGERTDRVKVSWRLDAPVGGTLLEVPAAADALVPVPADYPTMRLDRPDEAAAVRAEVGDRLSTALDAGERILGWCTEGFVLGV
jgi:predicted GNAT superfamily acetyltransferase